MLTSDQKIKINEKVQGFKEAADFYRMEYSQDLMGMFRDFGCMLLEACGINAEGDPEIKQLFGYRQVLRGTVKRQLTVIAEELAGLWKAPVSGEMFQTALSGMFNLQQGRQEPVSSSCGDRRATSWPCNLSGRNVKPW